MRTVALIACSSKKATAPCAAGDLYQGPLFKKARAYVEACGWEWRILSALHGVVEPTRTLAPYNVTLPKSEKNYRARWNEEVCFALRDLAESGGSPVRFVALAGQNYLDWTDLLVSIIGSPPESTVFTFPSSGVPITVDAPLMGLGIGQQMARLVELTHQARKAKRPC